LELLQIIAVGMIFAFARIMPFFLAFFLNANDSHSHSRPNANDSHSHLQRRQAPECESGKYTNYAPARQCASG
jgi:hypothetical protein